MRKKDKKSLRIIILAAIAGLLFLFVLSIFKKPSQDLSQQYSNQTQIQNTNLITYTNQDLKISFQYLREWYVDDRYRKILLTNYETNLNRDDKPSNNQIEILVDEFSGCHPDIEENLKDPACGEGGPSVQLNKILSKDVSQKKGGTFYTYVILSPDGREYTYYLLQKNNSDTILQISKQPDSSQFEREFENIINSITFL